VLNQLYKHSQMQTTFGVIMLALDHGVPKVMNLKQFLERFIEHRHDHHRRTQFDLDAAEAREHILEGLKIAVDNIDEVIQIIRSSADTPRRTSGCARASSCPRSRATRSSTCASPSSPGSSATSSRRSWRGAPTITELRGILASREKRMGILKEEMREVVKQFGDERAPRSGGPEDFTVEDLIAEEDMVITISNTGYIKRIPVSSYRKQRRGGRGLTGTDLKQDDWVEHLFIASTHDYLMFFTNLGQVYWLKVHEIPQASRAAKGKPV